MNEAEERAHKYLARCAFRLNQNNEVEVTLPFYRAGDYRLSPLVIERLKEKLRGRGRDFYQEGGYTGFTTLVFGNWEEVCRSETLSVAIAHFQSDIEYARAFAEKHNLPA